MANARTVQVQTETRGTVPEGAASFAVEHVGSLLRVASEPVLFARVKLIMAADPAVERPAVAQVNVDLNGRLIRAQAAGETMREAVEHACARLRVRLERAARNWAAIRGGQPVEGPGEWRHQSLPAARPPYFPRPAEERAVMRHKSYALAHETPDEAAADAELLDYDFHLFTEKSTGEDSVIWRSGTGAGWPWPTRGPAAWARSTRRSPSARSGRRDCRWPRRRLHWRRPGSRSFSSSTPKPAAAT